MFRYTISKLFMVPTLNCVEFYFRMPEVKQCYLLNRLFLYLQMDVSMLLKDPKNQLLVL